MENTSTIRKYRLYFTLTCVFFILAYFFVATLDVPQTSLIEYIKGSIKFILNLIPFVGFDVPEGVPTVYADVVLLLFAYIVGIAFFTQFALPLHNLGQRVLGFWYLVYFPFVRFIRRGSPGPISMIEDGDIPGSYPRKEDPGPGILLFDTASAGILRKRAAFTRPVGPGIVFTERGEYLAGTVDLHRKPWPAPPYGLGPFSGEDPFAPRNEKEEAEDVYKKRQERRFATSGETRDGVEVVTNIFVLSQVDPDIPLISAHQESPRTFKDRLKPYMQSDLYTEFKYNGEAVRLAITGEEIDPEKLRHDSDRAHSPWYELPAYLAADLWREYLRKFTFEELFKELPEYGTRTALQVIRHMVNERLQNLSVDGIDKNGRPMAEKIESREFKILRDRGVKIHYAVLRNIYVQKDIDQRLEDKWFAAWKWQAERERGTIDRLTSYSKHEGELDALRVFAYAASRRVFQEVIPLPKPRGEKELNEQMTLSLISMLRGTLHLCLSDIELHHRLKGEETQIADIVNWIKQNSA